MTEPGREVAHWLKLGYFEDLDSDPDYWRNVLWVSDGPGTGSSRWNREASPRRGDRRPPHGPHYAVGDRLVMYLTKGLGKGKCPAILEVIEEPRWDPQTVDDAKPGEGKNWGVLTRVRCIGAIPPSGAPSLADIHVSPVSIQRKGHVTLEGWKYAAAERQILGSSAGAEIADRDRQKRVAIEEGHVEGYEVVSSAAVAKAERRESRLVSDYATFLRARGDAVYRNKIRLPEDAGTLYSDLYNQTRGQLVEAKAGSDRASIRMAIGQLADYARFIHPWPSRAVLMEEKPRADLLELLETQQIGAIWRDGDGFAESGVAGTS